jgi:hypothetical protein
MRRSKKLYEDALQSLPNPHLPREFQGNFVEFPTWRDSILRPVTTQAMTMPLDQPARAAISRYFVAAMLLFLKIFSPKNGKIWQFLLNS